MLKLTTLLTVSIGIIGGVESVMLCYWNTYSYGRPGDRAFDVEDIDPHVCTHLIWHTALLDNVTWEVQVRDPDHALCDAGGSCGFQRFVNLKQENPDLKMLLAVSSGESDSPYWSTMAMSPEKRKTFATSCVDLLKEHKFDGLDIDWEYPNQRGGLPEDKGNFVFLLSDLREALHPESLILTTAVGNGGWLDSSYDHAGIAEQVDFVNLMTYDIHGPWQDYTHYNSPLYSYPELDALHGNGNSSMDWSAHHWLANGVPANKLLLGMAMYGHSYTLDDPTNTDVYAPASQSGSGSWGYNQICSTQQVEDWTVVRDTAMHEPYAYYLPRDNLWIGYDDLDSIKLKAEYATSLGLAGAFVWSIDLDDFTGVCHGKPFALINTITENMGTKLLTSPGPIMENLLHT